ncbi:MAG: hypothetical protein ACE5KO_03655 [Candidatus Bathyarchaeia archaeon]
MGRTIPSYRMIVENEIESWKKFGRALRPEDRVLFEEMFNACIIYASAGGFASRPVASEPMFMSILLAHQKALKELQKKLDRIEQCSGKD